MEKHSDRALDKIQLVLVTQHCTGDKAWSSEELSQLVFDLIWKDKDGTIEKLPIGPF